MKTCIRCKEVKFWFSFTTSFEGLYTAVYDVCSNCANELKIDAVRNYKAERP